MICLSRAGPPLRPSAPRFRRRRGRPRGDDRARRGVGTDDLAEQTAQLAMADHRGEGRRRRSRTGREKRQLQLVLSLQQVDVPHRQDRQRFVERVPKAEVDQDWRPQPLLPTSRCRRHGPRASLARRRKTQRCGEAGAVEAVRCAGVEEYRHGADALRRRKEPRQPRLEGGIVARPREKLGSARQHSELRPHSP